jgi:hypothetical protein
MKRHSTGFGLIARWVVLLALWWTALPSGLAAGTLHPATSEAFDYAEPKVLTGTLYAIGSNRKTVLYNFRRTATRSGAFVHVERQFFRTDGMLAAVDKVVYQSNQLVFYLMQEFQARVSGAVQVAPDPENPAQQQIFISYGPGLIPPKGNAQNLLPDTVFDDTVYPFMMAHWDALIRGDIVKFRFVSFEWERTFEFRFAKTGESVQNGQPVVQITMKPISLLVATLVNPLIFTVEKNGSHRVLSYLGRTTPRIQKGKSWKYLDAETVFDYQATDAHK